MIRADVKADDHIKANASPIPIDFRSKPSPQMKRAANSGGPVQYFVNQSLAVNTVFQCFGDCHLNNLVSVFVDLLTRCWVAHHAFRTLAAHDFADAW